MSPKKLFFSVIVILILFLVFVKIDTMIENYRYNKNKKSIIIAEESLSKKELVEAIDELIIKIQKSDPDLAVVLLTLKGSIESNSLDELSNICRKYCEFKIEELSSSNKSKDKKENDIKLKGDLKI